MWCVNRKINKCPHCEGVLEDTKKNKSFDWRLGDHRTLWPQLQVKFAVYTEDAELLERNMKRLYRKQINPNGHEIIEGVRLDEVVDQTRSFLKLFNIYSDKESEGYSIEDNIEKYNKNSLTHMKRCIEEIKEEIEEKDGEVEEIKKEIEEYKKYLEKKIEEYRDVELGEILSKFKLSKSGKKQIKYDRLVKYIDEKLKEIEEDGCKYNEEKSEDKDIRGKQKRRNKRPENYNEFVDSLMNDRLSKYKYKIKNDEAKKGEKYCNGFCQKYCRE